jgi:phosphoacetylglucosamine mutase
VNVSANSLIPEYRFFSPQLVLQFVKDEGILLGGHQTAQVLLGRDTRPTGEYLLDAALQVCHFSLSLRYICTLITICRFSLIGLLFKLKGINAIVGAHATDMGILTTPQLHWMVRCKNKGLRASESDYFTQLINSFRLLSSYCHAALGSHDLLASFTVSF